MVRGALSDRVAAASAGRDRVLDAVRVGALVLVMLAHSLAWHIANGTIGNVLEQRPGMAVITWGFQILALFFAAGGMSNGAALARHPDPNAWLGRRLRRLLGPVLVYASLWSVVLLPVAAIIGGDDVVMVGKFLSQLLWFAGVYLVVVALAPWTHRHRSPTVLVAWLLLIVAVDAVRWNLAVSLGWLNMLLVWGWLHQIGYELPRLRKLPATRLLGGAAAAIALAVGLAVLGPYSNSMVTYAGDAEPSNLAPPTLVVALHGLALILILAAAWRPLARLLERPQVWTPFALLASRGIGLYLWHIPLVGIAAGAALLLGLEIAPVGPAWWALHLTVAVLVIAGAWLLAGAAQHALPLLDRVPSRPSAAGAAALTAGAGIMVLLLSVTGFASWWSDGFLGAPASTPFTLALLWLVWRFRPEVRTGSPAAGSPRALDGPPPRPGRTAASG